jgi:predicted nucleic acid-binding protein
LWSSAKSLALDENIAIKRHNTYNCLYAALAERERCLLLTADDKLVGKLQPSFPFITPLSSLP